MRPPAPQQPAHNCEPGISRRSAFFGISTFLAAAPFATLLSRRANATPASTGDAGSLYKIVTYQVPVPHWQDFLALAEINAQASRQEPGVSSFTLLIPQDHAAAATRSAIAVEIYKSADASTAHQATGHFHAFVQGAQKLGVTRSILIADRYEPS